MSTTELDLERERDLATKGCSTMVDYSSGLIKDSNMRAAFKKSNIWIFKQDEKKQLVVGFLPWIDRSTKKIIKASDWMKKWVVKCVAEQFNPM